MIKLNKIAIYTNSGFPYGGAAENFVRLMAMGLKKNEQDVNVKLIRGHIWRNDTDSNDTGIKVSTVLFKYKPTKEYLKLLELILLILVIPFSVLTDKYKGKRNTIILYGIDYFYFVLPFMIFSKLCGIKLLRVVTDKYDKETIMPVWWKRPKLYFYNIQMKYIDKHLDGIVFLSTYLYDAFIRHGGKKSRAVVIPHFIDIDQFAIARRPNNAAIIIGYSGSIIRNNGIFDLLKAFRLLVDIKPDVKLMILGSANNLIAKEYDEFILKITALKNNVIWEGQVPYNDIANKLQQCSILINPRRKGEWADAGFPTKLGEYFSCEKIVLTTNVGDIPKYFTDGQELFISEPNNAFSLCEKLKYIVENIESCKTVASTGLKWANENLHYVISSQKLIQFINII